MFRRATTTALATVALGGVFAGAPAVQASANPNPESPPSGEQIYVNPSTGYPSSLPTSDDDVYVNPSTGFASSGGTADSPDAETALAGDQASASGFDWPSAAIGAAAGTALVLMFLAATTARGGQGRLMLRRGAVRP
jgi:hypothetical protein